MTEYLYTRHLINNLWDIDNILRVDESDNPIMLATEVEAALPNKIFNIKCSGDEAKISFDQALSSDDKTTLDKVVYDHQNNIQP